MYLHGTYSDNFTFTFTLSSGPVTLKSILTYENAFYWYIQVKDVKPEYLHAPLIFCTVTFCAH